MEVAIIDYNAGNVRSVLFAMERLGIQANLTSDPEEILKADKVIFPGVGEASTTMQYLKERKLDVLIKSLKQPTLGICLGLQLMCTHSEENDTKCLGIFPQKVLKFQPTEKQMKVPHMGWNTISDLTGKLFDKGLENEFVYFVHSYYAEQNEFTIARTHYGQTYSAAIQKDNFYATQFHPEKSGKAGETILRNFLEKI